MLIKYRNVLDPEFSGKQKSKILNQKFENEPSYIISVFCSFQKRLQLFPDFPYLYLNLSRIGKN